MIAGSMRPKSDQDTYQTHPPSLAREVSGAIYAAPQFFLLTTDRQAVCHVRSRRDNICLTTRSNRGSGDCQHGQECSARCNVQGQVATWVALIPSGLNASGGESVSSRSAVSVGVTDGIKGHYVRCFDQ